MEEKKIEESQTTKEAGPLRRRVDVMVFLLLVEFLLGMLVNLFGEAPSDTGQMQEPVWATVVFLTHGILGLFLLIGSIFLFVSAGKTENKKWKGFALQGMLSTILAALGGVSVVALKEGNPAEIASFIMAAGFLLSLISYGRFYFSLHR